MFNKLVKMRNKKAFTLVEMLVVIAIIAILVAIIIPVIGNSTTKSRAATNAANLRSIEGQLSTLRVERPDLFDEAISRLGDPLSSIIEGGGDVIARMFGYDSIQDLLKADNVFSQYVNYSVYHTTAKADGTLELSGEVGNSYVLENVPTAVGVSAGGSPGMEVAEGTPMTVYISPDGIMCTYESGTNAYTREDFALVAETGEFNGTASGGLTAEGGTSAVNCAIGNHDYGDSCTCKYCGKHKGLYVKKCNICEKYRCEIEGEHTYVSGKCMYCDKLRCTIEGKHTLDSNCKCEYCDGVFHTIANDKCTACGKYQCEITGTHTLSGKTCSICGKVWCKINGNECNYQYKDGTYHYCIYCETKGEHADGTWGFGTDDKCDTCKAVKTKCTCSSGILWWCTCDGHEHQTTINIADGCQYATWTAPTN